MGCPGSRDGGHCKGLAGPPHQALPPLPVPELVVGVEGQGGLQQREARVGHEQQADGGAAGAGGHTGERIPPSPSGCSAPYMYILQIYIYNMYANMGLGDPVY